MDIYTTEEEQIESIKRWWKKNGNYLLTLLTIVLLIFAGARWWQVRQDKISRLASTAYERLLVNLTNKDTSDVTAAANYLRKAYPGTPYAKMAALLLAKQAVNQAKLERAVSQLQWVVKNAKSASLQQIAQLRLARVYLALKKPQQALQTVKTIKVAAFSPLVNEVRGDIYLTLNKKEQARKAYTLAFQNLPPLADRAIVEMKLNSLS